MKNIARKPLRNPGFTLVVTLSLMILLTVVAVGLLSLSSVSLRSSAQGDAMSRARGNARLALMLAIGDLQKAAGPDTRVTATGSISDRAEATKRNITGVWESRKFDGSSLPTEDDYSKSGKAGKFKQWLVSDPDPAKTVEQQFAESAPPSADNRVTLVPPLKATGATIDPVLGNLVTVKGKQPGTYAYAVLDEGVKARVDAGFEAPYGGKPGDLAASLATGARPDVARIDGLEKIDWDAADLGKPDNLFSKTVSMQSGALLLGALGGSTRLSGALS